MKGNITAVIRDRKENGVTVKRGGYGFIQDENKQERFFHAHNVRGVAFMALREGLAVTFTPINVGGKGNGLRAEDVTVVAA